MPMTKIDSDELELMRNAFRKIHSFASSAGRTITNRDALEVIRALSREHVIAGPLPRSVPAIRRHIERVRGILEGVGRG